MTTPTRTYGDPAGEYMASTQTAGVVDRSYRIRYLVTGRAPSQMLKGVITGAVPVGPVESPHGLAKGSAEYSAVLTPKGRMVSDLRILRLDTGAADPTIPAGGLPGPATGAGERLLLDVPAPGSEPLRAHLARFLPPRFAKLEDATDSMRMLTVVGPDAADLLSREVLGLRSESADLLGLHEGEYFATGADGAFPTLVVRSNDVWPLAFDVIGGGEVIGALWTRLGQIEVPYVGHGVWETLRIEAGRPEFGIDMSDDTIPIEAGIDTRSIDHTKGCYTGQEVIVRIRDRGHVNRHLRGLLLGGVPAPGPRTPVFSPDNTDRPVGYITSTADSPRYGQTVALAYVRREIPVGGTVVVGGPGGPEGVVRELADAWGADGPPT